VSDGDQAGASERLRTAIESLNATIRDIRAYILDLRPRRFEGEDLVGGLQQLLSEFKANTLIQVEFSAEPGADRALSQEMRLALFHIAQEALSNAAKHSRATRMEVSLGLTGRHVELVLRDNGRGFKPAQVERRVGHGLMNMRDRAEAIGGELTINSPENQGTEIRVRAPKRPDTPRYAATTAAVAPLPFLAISSPNLVRASRPTRSAWAAHHASRTTQVSPSGHSPGSVAH
jgi:signal transduction histidine kinase